MTFSELISQVSCPREQSLFRYSLEPRNNLIWEMVFYSKLFFLRWLPGFKHGNFRRIEHEPLRPQELCWPIFPTRAYNRPVKMDNSGHSQSHSYTQKTSRKNSSDTLNFVYCNLQNQFADSFKHSSFKGVVKKAV